MTPRAARLTLAAWIALLAAVVAVLGATGHGALAPPPLSHPHRWGQWLEEREPLVAAFALVRLLAVLAAAQLVTTGVVGTVVRLLRAHRTAAVLDRLTVPALRRLLAGALGLSITSGALAGVARAETGPARPPPTVVMHRLPEAPMDQPPPTAPPVAAVPDGTWSVARGDCLWTIAEKVLTRAWGRPPSNAEVVPYWLRIIDLNRSRLVHPGNPDLIYPGQAFTVPVPGPPSRSQ